MVCGWIPKQNHMTSIVLGQYRQGRLVYKGHVTLGVGGEAFAAIKKQKIISHPPMEVPKAMRDENARWLKPELYAWCSICIKRRRDPCVSLYLRACGGISERKTCVESD